VIFLQLSEKSVGGQLHFHTLPIVECVLVYGYSSFSKKDH